MSLGKACAEGDYDQALQLIREGHNLEEQVEYSHREWKLTDIPVRKCTPLIIASSEGHVDIVLALVSSGADVDARDMFLGRTVLHYACDFGHLQIVRVLLDNGSKPNKMDDFNLTPLMLAIFVGQRNIACELVSRLSEEDVGVKDSDGHSALYYAHRMSFSKCTELLLNKMDQGDGEVNEAKIWLEDYKKKKISRAFKEGDLFVVERLIGGDIGQDEQLMYSHFSLIVASSEGHFNFVQNILPTGVNVNTKDIAQGRTALHYACSNGHLEIVKSLLGIMRLSRINQPDNSGKTALELAYWSGNYPIVQALICRGCNVLRKGLTALDLVALRTPLSLSFADINHPLISLLAQAGCRLTTEKIHAGVKAIVQNATLLPKKIVVVMGHACGGKSTLIAALLREGTLTVTKVFKQFQKVSNITERTAGIEPVSFKSQKYGEVIFYDFAGQHDYHGPHQTFLEALVNRPGTALTVLLLVRATEEEDDMRQQMRRWLQPLSWISSECSIQVTVVGSFADQVKDFKLTKNKLIRCCQSVLDRDVPHMIFTDPALLDCRRIQSDGIEKICSLIRQTQVPITLQNSPKKEYNVHWVLYHLKQFETLAFSIVKLQNWLTVNEIHPHLSESDILSLCKDLSSTGHVLFLESRQNPKQRSWLVLQLDKILHEVYGALFTEIAPKLNNQFGLVHVDQIAKVLPDFDHGFIASLLTSMDFCHEVDPSLYVRGILSARNKEGWLFFPCLVTAKPTSYFPKDQSSEYKYLCWQVNTSKEKFFSPRLLQAILLSLTTHQTVYSLDIQSEIQDNTLQVKEHCCNLWSNGITWQTTSGVDVLVQLFDNTIAQVIARTPQEEDPVILVHCLSSIAGYILHTVNQLYPDLMSHLQAFIIDSGDYTELCDNPKCTTPLQVFRISSIAKSLSNRESGNPYCLSLKEEGGHSTNKSIKKLFRGCVPSLDIISDMNPLERARCDGPPDTTDSSQPCYRQTSDDNQVPKKRDEDSILATRPYMLTSLDSETTNSNSNLRPSSSDNQNPKEMDDVICLGPAPQVVHLPRDGLQSSGTDQNLLINLSNSNLRPTSDGLCQVDTSLDPSVVIPQSSSAFNTIMQERVKSFLSTPSFHDFLHDHCDVRKIATKLHTLDAISRDELDKMAHPKGLKEANSSLYVALISDPSISKLKLVSEALKFDTSHEGHQTLAKRIDEFVKEFTAKENSLGCETLSSGILTAKPEITTPHYIVRTDSDPITEGTSDLLKDSKSTQSDHQTQSSYDKIKSQKFI